MIYADNFTGVYNFTGGTNSFTIQVDPTNANSSDGSNQNVAVTGSGNTFTLNPRNNCNSCISDLDWIIQGI